MPWSASERDEVVKALAVTCEVTATQFSGPAKTFLLLELENYIAMDVVNGLGRCAKECSGRLTLAGIRKAITATERQALSNAHAARSVYLTHLRGCALVERIAWNAADPESVRRELEAKGYHFSSAPKAPQRTLPQWTEQE